MYISSDKLIFCSPSQCGHKVNGKFIHHKPLTATEGKELVKIYDKDGTRSLIVPNRKPIDLPGILPQSEMERLKHQAHVFALSIPQTDC